MWLIRTPEMVAWVLTQAGIGAGVGRPLLRRRATRPVPQTGVGTEGRRSSTSCTTRGSSEIKRGSPPRTRDQGCARLANAEPRSERHEVDQATAFRPGPRPQHLSPGNHWCRESEPSRSWFDHRRRSLRAPSGTGQQGAEAGASHDGFVEPAADAHDTGAGTERDPVELEVRGPRSEVRCCRAAGVGFVSVADRRLKSEAKWTASNSGASYLHGGVCNWCGQGSLVLLAATLCREACRRAELTGHPAGPCLARTMSRW